MTLWHGSCVEVKEPDLRHSRTNTDFGRGFYVTPIYAQAESWCSKFKRQGKDGIISRYSFDEEQLESASGLRVLRFSSYSEAWLDFVISCRRLHDRSSYDIIIGGVTNDRVFNTLELYFDGLIDKQQATGRLRYEKPNLQLCFRTSAALSHLHFEGSERI